MNLKSASIRFAAVLGLATTAAVATVPVVMAQADTAPAAAGPHQPTPPPSPAAVVSQLGLTGSKASQVQQLLEQRQAQRIQFREAAKANHDKLLQLLTAAQWEQLQKIEHHHHGFDHGGRGHGDHHGHWHGGPHGPAPASAASAG